MALIYILKLENEKFYIGKTNKINTRINDHFNNKGSAWTRKYKPIEILDVLETEKSEDMITLEYMAKYSIDQVRGGSFCQISISDIERDIIQRMINSLKDKCYNCGQSDHFCNNCPQKKKQNLYCQYCKQYNIPDINNHLKYYCDKKPIYNSNKSVYDNILDLGSRLFNKKIYCNTCKRIGHYAYKCYYRSKINERYILD